MQTDGRKNGGVNPTKITSIAFENNEEIPQKYTCDGEDINPPLKFEDIPSDATSLALIVSDPDAPGKTFYHWVLFNMDPETSQIDEDSTPATTTSGTNDFDNTEYSGPCPPSDTHKYIFTLYALDGLLNLEEDTKSPDILEEMEGHIIEKAELIGLYSRGTK